MNQTESLDYSIIWSLFPKGIILPWITEDDTIPDHMIGIWVFCDGKTNWHSRNTNTDGPVPNISDDRFLMGVAAGQIGNYFNSANSGGSNEHDHVVRRDDNLADGNGFQRENHHYLGKSDKISHLPKYQKVRYIIKIK